MSAINWRAFAEAAKEAARESIDLARRADHECHFTHRGIEVLAVDKDGERIGDPLDYLEVKDLSGKRLAAIVKHQAPGQWDSITIQGGVDCYESLDHCMKHPDDYEPMVEVWDVSDQDIPGDNERHKVEYWERKRIEKALAATSTRLASQDTERERKGYKDAYSQPAAWVDA